MSGLPHLSELARVAAHSADSLAAPVAKYADLVRACLKSGGKLMYAGNGGSAAHAQHIATEYVIRYQPVQRRAVAAMALSTDSSLLTAGGNDLGFEQIFSRQVEALGRAGDLLVLVSTSGNSANLLRAAEKARERGLLIVGLLARDGGKLAKLVDLPIIVPTNDGAVAQEVHLAIDHHVCSVIEAEL